MRLFCGKLTFCSLSREQEVLERARRRAKERLASLGYGGGGMELGATEKFEPDADGKVKEELFSS